MDRAMTIAVLYTLPTKRAQKSAYAATDIDTGESASEIVAALKSLGYKTTDVPLGEDCIEQTITSIRADCIVNLIDWTGQDLPLSLQAMSALSASGIPYTGCDPYTFRIGTDKILMKENLDRYGIPTPRWQVCTAGDEKLRPDFSYPVVVKLAREHCSIGLDKLSVCTDEKGTKKIVIGKLRQFRQPVIVEEFISGREFQITVLETGNGTLWVLPPAEITFKKRGVDALLTYKSRWEEHDPEFHESGMALARLTAGQQQIFDDISKETFRAFKFRDFTRLDVRLKGDRDIYVLEANANPGLSDDPLYGMTVSYRAAGMTFAGFLERIILSAMRRFTRFPSEGKVSKN